MLQFLERYAKRQDFRCFTLPRRRWDTKGAGLETKEKGRNEKQRLLSKSIGRGKKKNRTNNENRRGQQGAQAKNQSNNATMCVGVFIVINPQKRTRSWCLTGPARGTQLLTSARRRRCRGLGRGDRRRRRRRGRRRVVTSYRGAVVAGLFAACALTTLRCQKSCATRTLSNARSSSGECPHCHGQSPRKTPT